MWVALKQCTVIQGGDCSSSAVQDGLRSHNHVADRSEHEQRPEGKAIRRLYGKEIETCGQTQPLNPREPRAGAGASNKRFNNAINFGHGV